MLCFQPIQDKQNFSNSIILFSSTVATKSLIYGNPLDCHIKNSVNSSSVYEEIKKQLQQETLISISSQQGPANSISMELKSSSGSSSKATWQHFHTCLYKNISILFVLLRALFDLFVSYQAATRLRFCSKFQINSIVCYLCLRIANTDPLLLADISTKREKNAISEKVWTR